MFLSFRHSFSSDTSQFLEQSSLRHFQLPVQASLLRPSKDTILAPYAPGQPRTLAQHIGHSGFDAFTTIKFPLTSFALGFYYSPMADMTSQRLEADGTLPPTRQEFAPEGLPLHDGALLLTASQTHRVHHEGRLRRARL